MLERTQDSIERVGRRQESVEAALNSLRGRSATGTPGEEVPPSEQDSDGGSNAASPREWSLVWKHPKNSPPRFDGKSEHFLCGNRDSLFMSI